jgi:hypothetical protein
MTNQDRIPSNLPKEVKELLERRFESERKKRIKVIAKIRKGFTEHGILGYRNLVAGIKKSESGDYCFRTAGRVRR